MSVSNQSGDGGAGSPESSQSSVLLWLISGSVFFGASFQIGTPLIQSKYDPGPSFISMVLGIILLVGGGGIWVARFIAKKLRRANSSNQRPIKMIGLVLSYIASIPFIGFHIATLVFGIASMNILRVSPKLSCIATAVLMLVVHLVFVEMFGIQLPKFSLLEYFRA